MFPAAFTPTFSDPPLPLRPFHSYRPIRVDKQKLRAIIHGSSDTYRTLVFQVASILKISYFNNYHSTYRTLLEHYQSPLLNINAKWSTDYTDEPSRTVHGGQPSQHRHRCLMLPK